MNIFLCFRYKSNDGDTIIILIDEETQITKN